MGVLPAAYSAAEILCHVAVETLGHVPHVQRTQQWSTATLPFGTDLRGHQTSDPSGPDALCSVPVPAEARNQRKTLIGDHRPTGRRKRVSRTSALLVDGPSNNTQIYEGSSPCAVAAALPVDA
jgi:hypothetical protein